MFDGKINLDQGVKYFVEFERDNNLMFNFPRYKEIIRKKPPNDTGLVFTLSANLG